VTAGTPAAAAQELRGQGLTPLEIVSAEGRPLESEKSDRGFGKPRRRDILIFTSQLAAMLRAGMILPDALRIISTQSENPRLRGIVRTVRESVMGGSSLSDALRRYPRIWNKLYCNMVQVGETSGRLGDVLSRLAGHLESSQVLRSSIFSALAYPAVILFVGIASVIVLLIFVIPNLSAAFTELDMQLPWLTTTIIGLSGWLASHWWAPLLAVVGLGAAMRSVLSKPEGRFWLDSRRRRVPILGPTMDKVHLAQMAQTMGILVRSGIPVLTSLELASETTASPVLARALRESAEKVRHARESPNPWTRPAPFPEWSPT
jgi:type II secretory pathway component PulF